MTTQAGAVAAGPFDRPGPQHRVVVGELHQLGIALGCRLDGDLAEDTTGRGVERRRGVSVDVSVDVGVDADDDIDHLTQIGQTVHAFSPSPDGTWFRSGTEARQDCDETRPAPLTPGGQAPDQASSSNRAGAGDHERTGRTKARSQSFRGSHPRSPTTAQHHQAALAILTVTPPRAVLRHAAASWLASRSTTDPISAPTATPVCRGVCVAPAPHQSEARPHWIPWRSIAAFIQQIRGGLTHGLYPWPVSDPFFGIHSCPPLVSGGAWSRGAKVRGRCVIVCATSHSPSWRTYGFALSHSPSWRTYASARDQSSRRTSPPACCTSPRHHMRPPST